MAAVMEPASIPRESSVDHLPSDGLATSFDPSLNDYLRRLLPPLLSAEPNAVSALLASDAYLELAPRFAAESVVPVVYVVKSRAVAADGTELDVEGESGDISMYSRVL
jgi:hypothetical protein